MSKRNKRSSQRKAQLVFQPRDTSTSDDRKVLTKEEIQKKYGKDFANSLQHWG